MKQQDHQPTGDLIIGRNPVMEALKAGRPIETLLIAGGEKDGSLKVITALAKERQITVKETDRKKLDALCKGAVHQGVAAVAAVKAYACVDDMFALAKERGEAPFLIVLDELEDPHNVGAVIRTAECAGAHGVIIPKRRSVGLTFTVGKASAGAYEYVPVARVSNIASTLEELKQRGCWVYGADMQGETYCTADLRGPSVLVIGSEGRGLGRLVREKCDTILSLPMQGHINSLNASVAAGVLMYEFARQRLNIKAYGAGGQ